jgi:uncharacterized protein (DUF1800 family)
VNGGYTQQDIVEVARCFTRLALPRQPAGRDAGTFFYGPNRHDNNAKTVLGNTIPGGGDAGRHHRDADPGGTSEHGDVRLAIS